MPSVPVSVATSGQTQLVAAPGAGRRIRVLDFFIVGAAAVTWKLQSANNDLMGAASLVTGQPHADGPWSDGLRDCNVNEALNINLGGAVQVSGFVVYTTIPG